jgi:hypothetical protein
MTPGVASAPWGQLSESEASSMVRNILGSLIALVGAAAAVWSPFRAWYDGRHASKIRVGDLFTGLTGHNAAVLGSVFLPLAVAGLLTLAAVLFRSRIATGVAGLLVLATVVLWGFQQARTPANLSTHSLDSGVAYALIGGVLILIGSALMSGRPGKGRHRTEGRTVPDEVEP